MSARKCLPTAAAAPGCASGEQAGASQAGHTREARAHPKAAFMLLEQV